MKAYKFIKLAIFIAFSVLLLVFKNDLVADLNYFVGSLVLAFGLESTIVISIVSKKQAIKSIKFSFSIFEMILGLTILTAVKNFEFVCVMWAVWSILRQSIDIHEVLSGEVKGVLAVLLFVQSVVSIVFSILLIITPTEHHAVSHIYLLIAELLVIALPPVVDEIRNDMKIRKQENS